MSLDSLKPLSHVLPQSPAATTSSSAGCRTPDSKLPEGFVDPNDPDRLSHWNIDALGLCATPINIPVEASSSTTSSARQSDTAAVAPEISAIDIPLRRHFLY